MGKPTGFLEFTRELPVDKAPLERINNWDEFHLHLPEENLRNQGARCMDCGTPFCHTGELISGMASGCPVNNLIPEWNDLIYRGLWQEALDRLHKTNNFPEFTGRVCPAPCEGSCVLGINNPPVTIKNIECSIIDHGWDQGWVKPQPPEKRTGKKIAIVGSGPAGLSAAAQLNKAGHSVTVYEKDDRPGGLLMYGIPNMKLDKEKVVLRRVKLLEEEGVKFVCNSTIGKDIPAETLVNDNDAVILAIGAGKPRDLPIEGRSLKGINFAMDFLTANTKAVLSDNPEEFISAKGKDVVIIGGGDTGTDCVGTSIRHGCNSVTQLEIMPQPPEIRAKNNPWPEYPKIYRLDYGQEEAAAKFGNDPRVYTTTATKFEGDSEGNVIAVHTVEVEWARDEQGRFTPNPIKGTEKRLPAQLVLLAMGFLGPEQLLLEQMGLEKDNRSNIKAEYGEYATSIPNVFAAGDCRRGQSLVVWAFNEGRGVAKECDRFLMGYTDLP
ncbi:MAG: glutamate synthase subunit beta [Cyanobacteria bacterium]|nr:glutamate synthase subunit beta [Cyanobacteria bacterium CG_2015-16_32_12]NCO79228.1 glutamate synthase subunit beta [Cyanobacteria bacterium CG_2015-22_32_23]NCQ04244.1 glutamate synthase subunit beta [Cyanobacteria bacterium CG_2015-09_32_10]NCQ41287.1 glutamate synthase subunit beta [Cyanobacteria bacterium CG_2015-04_32_10]NCS85326.1 glutamate synthase subunit beta [Cyanobacteria bacterium CG_2015-02_32_10]